MDRLTELKNELAAAAIYGEGIGEQLQNPDLSDRERADLDAEMEAVETKVQDLRRKVNDQQKSDERELRIANIGREMGVKAEAQEEQTVEYKTALDKLFDNPTFKAAVTDRNVRDQRFDTGAIEWKATDPQATNPDEDLVQHLRPGIISPFVYPRRVGPLFAQSQMEGSSISWLFVNSADGGADYVSYGGQKPDGSIDLDVDLIKAAKIAAIYTVPDDALDDLPALRGTLTQMLMVGPNGIEQKAETEYVQGAGGTSPQELKGIDALSPDDASGTGDNVVKDVLAASLDIESSTGFPATAVVINPADVFDVMTLEPVGGDGRPLFNAFGGGYRLPDIGIPWVLSKAAPAGTLYVGAFNTSILYTRQAVNIRATSEGIGLADKNLTMFVAETRQALVHPYGKETYRTVSTGS